MKDQTAMERLLYLVRTTGVEFTIASNATGCGVIIRLSLPNGWRYTAQRAIPHHDIERASVPADDVIRHAIDALEQQLRTDGTEAQHRDQKRERLARGYGYGGVSPVAPLMGPNTFRRLVTLPNPYQNMELVVDEGGETTPEAPPRFQTREMTVDWSRVNKALVDWYRKNADWPRLGAIDL